jgi:bifunctional DNA-binding transcriptional regulator/antitoxin component of YhaV-PrlF toxin-antitoxin module
MKLKVDQHGVTVPKHMLGDADEVNVREENGHIVLEPISQSENRDDLEEDPILGLGQDTQLIVKLAQKQIRRYDVHRGRPLDHVLKG